MTNGSSERLDRIERILEEMAKGQERFRDEMTRSQQQIREHQEQVAKSLPEMAARQQHHDEAFERREAEMKVIRAAIATDAQDIRILLTAELLHHRPEHLEGGEPA